MPARVLVVEDNPDNQFIYRAGLQHAGFEVLIAGDGWKGLELARSELPAIILMDISIPGIDGLELTRRLKRQGRVSALRAKVTTAARKWEREGGARTIALMWALRLLYACGASPARLHRWYYPDLR